MCVHATHTHTLHVTTLPTPIVHTHTHTPSVATPHLVVPFKGPGGYYSGRRSPQVTSLRGYDDAPDTVHVPAAVCYYRDATVVLHTRGCTIAEHEGPSVTTHAASHFPCSPLCVGMRGYDSIAAARRRWRCPGPAGCGHRGHQPQAAQTPGRGRRATGRGFGEWSDRHLVVRGRTHLGTTHVRTTRRPPPPLPTSSSGSSTLPRSRRLRPCPRSSRSPAPPLPSPPYPRA